MLPSLLSEHLCSLRAGLDRCAVTVLWTLNADLKVESIWFGRSVIRCAAVSVLWTPNADISVESIWFGRSIIRRAAVRSIRALYAAVFVSNPVCLRNKLTLRCMPCPLTQDVFAGNMPSAFAASVAVCSCNANTQVMQVPLLCTTQARYIKCTTCIVPVCSRLLLSRQKDFSVFA